MQRSFFGVFHIMAHSSCDAVLLRTRRRSLVWVVASVLAGMPMGVVAQWRDPATATSIPVTTVNSTQINFAGHEWVVIGNAGTDIYTNGTYGGASQPTDSVTLLLKNGDVGFGNSAFRAYVSGSGYEGTYSNPNDYNDSTLQERLVEIANNLPAKEQGLINERTLQPVGDGFADSLTELNEGDGINGVAVNGQKLWALSYPEWNAIGIAVRSWPSS